MKSIIKQLGILSILSLWIVISLYAQKKYTKQTLIEDFNTYITFIEQTHPDPYTSFGGRVEFGRAVQNARAGINKSTTLEQFREILLSLISKLEDGHTTIYTNNDNNDKTGKQLPFKLKVSTDGIFIVCTTKEYTTYSGSKLIAVNNTPVDSLLKKTNRLRPAENKYGALYELCNLLSYQTSTELLFGKISSLQLNIKSVKGQESTISTSYTETPDWIKDDSKVALKKDNNLLYSQMLGENSDVGYFVWNSISSQEMVQSVAKSSPNYLDMNLNSVYKSMNKPRPEDNKEAINGIPALYSTFFDLLKTMQSQKSNYLIIDLRENGGGMTPLCFPLLYMLYGDKYLNFNSKAEYDRLLSPLLLKKWNVKSIEQFNKSNNTNYRLGDFTFGQLFGSSSENETIEEKRKDLSRIAYFGGIGKEYTKNLNGVPVYEPHVIVLVSPKTFSAAYHFLYLLTQIGQATVVGVPSRQAGNTFMETTQFELPNTKISGSISNALQIIFPDNPEKGKTFMPDFALQWSDYANYDFDENTEILYTLDLIKQRKVK